ncbi:MAG: ATP-binding protein [Firmicutes bacterium]|nr:ATP-binding protein [Bacillota bacterium]
MTIAVASGKGGTGKTTVATNLALAIAAQHPVQFLDCDVEEPNAHLFLKPRIERTLAVEIPVPSVDRERCTYCGTCADVCAQHAVGVFPGQVLIFAELCHGCGACALFCPEGAITEVGRPVGVVEAGRADQLAFAHGRLNVGEAFAPPVVRAVKKEARDHGIVIIDVAPGTSCPVVEALKGVDFCLLVTEPTPFGLHDLKLMVGVVEKLGIPAALVINRADMGDAGVWTFCRQKRIPVLMEIPQNRRIAESYARGIPLVRTDGEWAGRFAVLFRRIRALVEGPGSRNGLRGSGCERSSGDQR